MRLVKDKGGYSIAVYKPNTSTKKQTAYKLINDNRVNFVCPADYSENGEIHSVVKTILDKIKADTDFQNLETLHKNKSKKNKNKKDEVCKPSNISELPFINDVSDNNVKESDSTNT